jgi:hypothetical protein
MKNLYALALALLVGSWSGQAQSILRNSITTNTLGTNFVWNPATLRLRESGATPSLELWNTSGTANFRRFLFNNASDQLRVEWSDDAGGSSLLLSTWSADGTLATVKLGLSGTTNRLSIANNTLLLDGVAIGGSTSTNYYSTIITTNMTVLNSLTVSNISVTNVTVQNNLTVSNLYTVNGNHNTLIVTNALTLQTIKTNLLATDGNGVITNAVYGTGISWDPTTRTLSSTASGGSTGSTNYRSAVVTLTMSGTNVTANSIDWNLTNVCYSLLLTNNAYFGAAVCTNVPGTSSFQWLQLDLIQDSTGARLVQFDNTIFAGVNGTFAVTTNANAWDSLTLINSRQTNGNVAVIPVNWLHR